MDRARTYARRIVEMIGKANLQAIEDAIAGSIRTAWELGKRAGARPARRARPKSSVRPRV